MGESFYTILTDTGKAKIANSQVLGNKVNITEFAVGDGGGGYYNPSSEATGLKNEVWRGVVSQINIDSQNPNWIVLETIIPAEVGGFMVREGGIFDSEGDLIAIGKFPETFKPDVEAGSAKDLFIKMILEVSNASSVTLKIDPTIAIASKKDIEVLSNRIDEVKTSKARVVLSVVEPLNADENTFWFEDKGDSIDFGSGGDGIVVANASTDPTADEKFLFKEI